MAKRTAWWACCRPTSSCSHRRSRCSCRSRSRRSRCRTTRAAMSSAQMVARLRPGATIAQANAQFKIIVDRNIERLPARAAFARSSGFGGYAVSLRDQLVGDVRGAAVLASGRRDRGPADRVRQCREPAPDAGDRSPPRAGHSDDARCRSRADRETAPRRGSGAVDCGCRGRRCARVARREALDRDVSPAAAGSADCGDPSVGPALHHGRLRS